MFVPICLVRKVSECIKLYEKNICYSKMSHSAATSNNILIDNVQSVFAIYFWALRSIRTNVFNIQWKQGNTIEQKPLTCTSWSGQMYYHQRSAVLHRQFSIPTEYISNNNKSCFNLTWENLPSLHANKRSFHLVKGSVCMETSG